MVCLKLLDEFGGGIQPKPGLNRIGGLLAFVPELAERSAKGLNLAFKVLVVLRLTANVLGHPLCRVFALYRLNLLVNGEILLQKRDVRFKVTYGLLTGLLCGGLSLTGFLIVVNAHYGLIEVGLLLAGLNKLVELALFIRGDASYGFGLITKFGNVSIVFFDTLHDRGNLIDKGICIVSTTALGFLTPAKYFLQRRHTFIVSLRGLNEIGAKGCGASAHISIKECAWQTNSATANLAEILLVILVGEFARDYVAPDVLLLVDRPLVYLCGFLERLIDIVGGGIKRFQHRIRLAFKELGLLSLFNLVGKELVGICKVLNLPLLCANLLEIRPKAVLNSKTGLIVFLRAFLCEFELRKEPIQFHILCGKGGFVLVNTLAGCLRDFLRVRHIVVELVEGISGGGDSGGENGVGIGKDSGLNLLQHQQEIEGGGEQALANGGHYEQSGLIRAEGDNQFLQHAAHILIVCNEVGNASHHVLDRAGVCLTECGQHILPAALQDVHLTRESLCQDLLHLVELTTFGGHILKGLLHHFKRNLALRHLVEHLTERNGAMLQLGEHLGEFIQHGNTILREGTQLDATEEAGGLHMTVGEDQPIHRHTNAGCHIAEHLRGFQKAVLVNVEGGKLFGILCEFRESVGGIGRESVQILKNLVRAVYILKHIAERHSLHLKLPRDVKKGREETPDANNGERGPRQLRESPHQRICPGKGGVHARKTSLCRTRLGNHLVEFRENLLERGIKLICIAHKERSFRHIRHSALNLGEIPKQLRSVVYARFRHKYARTDGEKLGKFRVETLGEFLVCRNRVPKVGIVQYDLKIEGVYACHSMLLLKYFSHSVGDFSPLFCGPAFKSLAYCFFLFLEGRIIGSRSWRSTASATTFLLSVQQRMGQVGLHKFYLGAGQDAPIPKVSLPASEPPARPSVLGEVLAERRFSTKRSSARYCSASFFVIFIISVLISSEYAIM